MLEIDWHDRRTNLSVPQQAGIPSVECAVVKNQLRWCGHVVRMSSERLPKPMFYCEMSDGKRGAGGPKRRYKDGLKKLLIPCEIPIANWENMAMNRCQWRKTVCPVEKDGAFWGKEIQTEKK